MKHLLPNSRCWSKILLLFCLGLLLLGGCSRKYVITLKNGTQVTTEGKPRLDRGHYQFTDVRGRKSSVPEGRVLEIAPASMAREENAKFKPASN